MKCVCCGSTLLTSEDELIIIQHGDVPDGIPALVSLIRCMVCDESWSDATSENSMHEAVCRHFGRLTPSEITAARSQLGVTTETLAAMVGVGRDDVWRYESGLKMQPPHIDERLRSVAGVKS